MTEPETRLSDAEHTRIGWALLSATYGEAELGYDYDELVGTYSLQDREEAWSLVAGLLLEYLCHQGTELGCGCGGAEWFDRVMLGEADHG